MAVAKWRCIRVFHVKIRPWTTLKLAGNCTFLHRCHGNHIGTMATPPMELPLTDTTLTASASNKKKRHCGKKLVWAQLVVLQNTLFVWLSTHFHLKIGNKNKAIHVSTKLAAAMNNYGSAFGWSFFACGGTSFCVRQPFRLIVCCKLCWYNWLYLTTATQCRSSFTCQTG